MQWSKSNFICHRCSYSILISAIDAAIKVKFYLSSMQIFYLSICYRCSNPCSILPAIDAAILFLHLLSMQQSKFNFICHRCRYSTILSALDAAIKVQFYLPSIQLFYSSICSQCSDRSPILPAIDTDILLLHMQSMLRSKFTFTCHQCSYSTFPSAIDAAIKVQFYLQSIQIFYYSICYRCNNQSSLLPAIDAAIILFHLLLMWRSNLPSIQHRKLLPHHGQCKVASRAIFKSHQAHIYL